MIPGLQVETAGDGEESLARKLYNGKAPAGELRWQLGARGVSSAANVFLSPRIV